MELNVWTSSIATKAIREADTGKWIVTVKREDGTERLFRVDHVVFALGLGAGKPNIPQIPGQVRPVFLVTKREMLILVVGELQRPSLTFDSAPQCERSHRQESARYRSLHIW